MRSLALHGEQRSGDGDVASSHQHIWIESVCRYRRSKSWYRDFERWEMIEPPIDGDFILDGTRMIPSYPFLRSAWKDRTCIMNVSICHWNPALIQKGHSAGRES